MESVKHIILAESQTPGALIIKGTLLFASGQKASRELCKLNKLSSGTIKKSNSQRMDKKTIKGKKKTSQGEQEEEFVLPANPPGHAGEGPGGREVGFVGFDV